MAVLLIVEEDQGQVADATRRAASLARQMGDVVALVAHNGNEALVEGTATLDGVTKVLNVNDASLSGKQADVMAALIASLGADYDALIAGATTWSKDIMPRAAALLDVMQVSDITAMIDMETFERPIYAGNAIEVIKTNDKVKVITVRGTCFEPVDDSDKANIEQIPMINANQLIEFMGEERSKSERPELTTAGIVVSGGRGIGSKENFALIEAVADKLNAAVGASRAAVDAGFAPNDRQIGQTGKVVAPDLYIAIGISGAIQHLAGMKDSKYIVAINKDDEAPIFRVADYGLVGDLFDVVPELEKAL